MMSSSLLIPVEDVLGGYMQPWSINKHPRVSYFEQSIPYSVDVTRRTSHVISATGKAPLWFDHDATRCKIKAAHCCVLTTQLR